MTLQSKRVLFVCLGNTCRSPIAEAVFFKLIKERNIQSDWIVDSAAIREWHVGKPANPRAMRVLQNHGVNYNGETRQITTEDFRINDYIFGMDNYNITYLIQVANAVVNNKAQIYLLGDYDPLGERIIEDPFCDRTLEGFEKCYEQCMRSCAGFLDNFYKN